MKRITLMLIILSIWCIGTASFVKIAYSLDFWVTLNIDKTVYHPGELVNITGSVIYNGSLIFELVGLQVNDINDTMVFRTVYTFPSSAPPVIDGDVNGDGFVDIFDIVIVALAFGSSTGNPNYNIFADINKDGTVDIFDMAVVAIHYGQGDTPRIWRIQVIDAYIGDLYGNPVGTTARGIDYYVWVHYKNTQPIPLYTVLAFTIYDSNDVPLYGSYISYGVVNPGGPYASSIRWRVPTGAALGAAKVYASAYSDFPQSGGYPYCPEKSSTFNVVASLGLLQTDFQTMETPGYYNNVFRIPTVGTKIGTYHIYATSFHFTGQIGLIASNSTSFQVQP